MRKRETERRGVMLQRGYPESNLLRARDVSKSHSDVRVHQLASVNRKETALVLNKLTHTHTHARCLPGHTGGYACWARRHLRRCTERVLAAVTEGIDDGLSRSGWDRRSTESRGGV